MKDSFWIGKPLGKNKPHNFFKTSKKMMPVNLFKDSDRDGVANVFDCRPFDRNRQGFIKRLLGMEKKKVEVEVKPQFETYDKPVPEKKQGRLAKIFFRPDETRKQKLERLGMEAQSSQPIAKPYKPKVALAMIPYDYDYQMSGEKPDPSALGRMDETVQEGIDQIKDKEERQRLREYRKQKMIYGVKKAYYKTGKATDRVNLTLKRLNPKYSFAMENRAKRIKDIKNELGELIQTQGKDVMNSRYFKMRVKQYENAKRVQASQDRYYKSKSRKQAIRSGTLSVTNLFPMVYATAGSHVMGAPGQRGRPRGSIDPRYRAYGGVLGYRRYIAAQKRAYKMAMAQQKQQMKMARQPQYEQQAYQEQAQTEQQLSPQEMAAIRQAEVQQNAQIPQQIQQNMQEYPPEPQKRPITTIFKSSGGKPYPAVDNTPLQSARQTVPYGYVEEVDSFTGRRFLKRLPQPERWSAG